MIRIDQLDTTLYPSLAHFFAAMKDGLTVQLSVQQVADLVKAYLAEDAPATLDTIKEIATALQDNPDVITTLLSEQTLRLKRDGSNFADDPEKVTFRAAAGITELLAETLTDDLQFQEVTIPVAAVDFPIPATGEAFLIIGTEINMSGTSSVAFRTSPDGVSFDAGATDYAARYIFSAGAVSTNELTQDRGLLHSGDQLLATPLIGAHFFGLLTPGSATQWPSTLTMAHGYNSGSAYDLSLNTARRRNNARINSFRFYANGFNFTSGRFAIARIRGF